MIANFFYPSCTKEKQLKFLSNLFNMFFFRWRNSFNTSILLNCCEFIQFECLSQNKTRISEKKQQISFDLITWLIKFLCWHWVSSRKHKITTKIRFFSTQDISQIFIHNKQLIHTIQFLSHTCQPNIYVLGRNTTEISKQLTLSTFEQIFGAENLSVMLILIPFPLGCNMNRKCNRMQTCLFNMKKVHIWISWIDWPTWMTLKDNLPSADTHH